MHFKVAAPTMDTAESFRHVQADVSKTDFFELVTSPELTDAQFKQQMRSVNAFLESSCGGNPLLSGEPRTATQPNANAPPLQSFDSIWNADRERDRLETAILEDLNKFYWSQEQEHELEGEPPSDAPPPPPPPSQLPSKTDASLQDNTDGQIYTLTVLDNEPSPTWDRTKRQPPPLPSPAPDHASLDLDSILNIMPNQINGFPLESEFLGVKEEPFGFEDSGFADHKDALDNNNDWKLADQNGGGGESLLRSALQGRGARYVPRSSPPAPPPPVVSVDNDSIVIFDSTRCRQSDETDVDDILLSQLDTSYSDDYARMEVGDQFCTSEEANGRVVYSIQQLGGGAGLVTMLPTQQQQQQQQQLVTSPAVVSSTKSVAKKYKRSTSKAQSPAAANGHQATSTSNGIRKERSLHYCSICSKGFKDKYSVNVHIRTHTGEKPFACSLCGKSFRQKAHLAKHYQTHIAQKNAAAAGAVKANKQR